MAPLLSVIEQHVMPLIRDIDRLRAENSSNDGTACDVAALVELLHQWNANPTLSPLISTQMRSKITSALLLYGEFEQGFEMQPNHVERLIYGDDNGISKQTAAKEVEEESSSSSSSSSPPSMEENAAQKQSVQGNASGGRPRKLTKILNSGERQRQQEGQQQQHRHHRKRRHDSSDQDYSSQQAFSQNANRMQNQEASENDDETREEEDARARIEDDASKDREARVIQQLRDEHSRKRARHAAPVTMARENDDDAASRAEQRRHATNMRRLAEAMHRANRRRRTQEKLRNLGSHLFSCSECNSRNTTYCFQTDPATLNTMVGARVIVCCFDCGEETAEFFHVGDDNNSNENRASLPLSQPTTNASLPLSRPTTTTEQRAGEEEDAPEEGEVQTVVIPPVAENTHAAAVDDIFSTLNRAVNDDDDDDIPCEACGSWQTSYYHSQPRGADDRTTKVVSCNDCGESFRV